MTTATPNTLAEDAVKRHFGPRGWFNLQTPPD